MVVMKQLRQRAIRDLVEQRPIRTQQELAAALRDRGFRTTQATISRDIAELQLVKSHRDGVSVYALPPRLADADPTGEDRLRRLFRDLPVEIQPVDPGGSNLGRSGDANRGNAAASKPSISGSLASPGAASIGNAPGSLSLSTRASSAPIRPDARDVRRELEQARRTLGL